MGTNTRKRNLHDSYICRDIGLSQQPLKNKKREEGKKKEKQKTQSQHPLMSNRYVQV